MRVLTIGERGGIVNLRQRFALTGMAHLLVISGLHLGMVAASVFLPCACCWAFSRLLMAGG